jgi:TonB family protein
MRIIMFALLGRVAFSQTADDARRLIQEVADAAKNTTNWQIEGSISYPKSSADHTSSEQFKLLIRSPSEVRFEQSGETAPAVIVCDDTNAWIYSPPLHRYRKQPSAYNKLCSPIVADWKALPTSLESPVFAGFCGPDPSSKSSIYPLVRGVSEPELSSAGRIKRTLCIDRDRKLILWEKWESQHSSRIYTYSKLDQAAEFTSEPFTFEPPPDSTLTDLELPTPHALGTRGISTGPGISLPRVVSKKEPRYGQESLKAGIEGMVVLYVVIGTNGVPSDILVYRHLTPDLDTEAVSSVRRWRFTPALNNGQPAALPVTVEVNFRLRHR